MLYYLITPLVEQFRYITFRASFAAVLSFLFCVVLLPVLSRYLKSKKVMERVEKKDSDKLIELHRHKADTPTMGGVIVLAALLVITFLFARTSNIFVVYALLLTLGLGLLGYYDDIVKLKSVKKGGISKSFKLLGQIIIGLGIGFGLWNYFNLNPDKFPQGTELYLPLVKTSFEMGLVYPFFVALVIVASSNAVNLTDGLDGLATGCLIMAGLAYAVIVYITGRFDYTRHLEVPYMPGTGELTVFMAGFIGACIGFLWFNGFPAEVFMGNVGAVALGGVLGELVLFLVGAIFVMEALSVLMQIISYQGWGKRIFKIAPLHHHYQFNGWSEPKITLRFWIIAAILAIMSLATLKIEIF
ncbi:MAG: phospho-N-acetylmuramoyl-pentapeptide-transferase [Planctomycetes bacterium]|nr:phospho-N-acetylmuramoyl-pentapeptide-transferase [Planctomycetota bacterium]